MRKEIAILLIVVAAVLGYLVGYATAPTPTEKTKPAVSREDGPSAPSIAPGDEGGRSPGYGKARTPKSEETSSPGYGQAPSPGYGKARLPGSGSKTAPGYGAQ